MAKIILTGDSARAVRTRAILDCWPVLAAGSDKADLLEAVQLVDGCEETTAAQLGVEIGLIKKLMPKVFKKMPALKGGQRGRAKVEGADEASVLAYLESQAADNADDSEDDA